MKIVIVGAGKIGSNLAKSLTEESHEVYLIESNKAIAQKIAEKLDVKVIVGQGADPDTLHKAYIKDADLVLAVTTSDETNLVVCSLAATFGAKRKIARVRSTSLRNTITEQGYSKFNVDDIINPELVAAQAIVKTIDSPGANEVSEFANGRILLRRFDVPETSPICGNSVQEFSDEDFPWPFLIVAIIREEEVMIPTGETVIQKNDHIYALLPANSLAEFVTFVNPEIKVPKKIVIYGASITGKHVAMTLAERIKNITLVEEDLEVANEIAGSLGHVKIINGSAAEAEILTECGIEATDIFIATSENDHSNLVSSVLAKKMGAKTTIITTQQPDYMSIVDALNIDVIINPHYLAVEQLLHLVRGRGISAVTKLLECNAEALELIPEEGSPITKDVLKNIKMPKNSIVGAYYKGDEVNLANGDTQIHEGEKVIVFCQDSAVKKIQELFTR